MGRKTDGSASRGPPDGRRKADAHTVEWRADYTPEIYTRRSGGSSLQTGYAYFAHREHSDHSIMNGQIGHRERSAATLGVR